MFGILPSELDRRMTVLDFYEVLEHLHEPTDQEILEAYLEDLEDSGNG